MALLCTAISNFFYSRQILTGLGIAAVSTPPWNKFPGSHIKSSKDDCVRNKSTLKRSLYIIEINFRGIDVIQLIQFYTSKSLVENHLKHY